MHKIKQAGALFIITAAVLWSFDGLLRTTLYSLPPSIIVFWEHAIGLLLLTPFVLGRIGEVKRFALKEWLSVAAVSLFSGALGTILYTAALGRVHFIQFSVVVLLQQLQPIWAIIAASILLKEKITPNFLKWAAVAIAASYFVTFKNLSANISSDPATAVAGLLAVLAGMMWGTSTSFSKIVLKKATYLTATYLRFFITPLFSLAIIILLRETSAFTSLTGNQWLTLLLISLSTGMVAILIYYYGLRNTQARMSAIYELAWPASAILIDYFYFKRPLSHTQIAGTLVLLFAMYRISSIKKDAGQLAEI